MGVARNAGSRRSAERAPNALRDILLNDLKVVDARSVIIETGRGGVVFPPTRHAMLHLVLSGTVFFWTSKSMSAAQADAGDCVLIFYGDRHGFRDTPQSVMADVAVTVWSPLAAEPETLRLGTQPAGSVLSVAIDLAYVSPSAFAHRAGPDFWLLRRNPTEHGDARSLALDLDQVRAGCAGSGGSAFAMTLAAFMFVHMVRDMRKRNWHDRKAEVFTPNTRRVAVAIQQIHSHLNHEWTVALLAQEVGLSRSAFAGAFHSHVGVTPLSYITDLRMRRAAQLLEIEGITSREVAERVGYSLESSFARTFKKYYGVSPRAFAAPYRNLRHEYVSG
jgi:AraC-like DNA-binding protein